MIHTCPIVVTTSARAWAASAPVPWSSSSRWVNSYNDQDGDDSGDHVDHDAHDHDHDNGEDEKGDKVKSP